MPFSMDGTALSSYVLVGLCLVLLVISAFRPNSFQSVRMGMSDLLYPVLSVVSAPFQYVSMFFHDITGLAQLQADNLRMKQENERLRDWYQTALLLDSENKALRKLLNLSVEAEYKHVSARVFSDTGNTYVKSLLVGVGKKDDVKKGSAVVSGDGLTGRVIEVGEKTSRILLVTDINSRVPIVVEDTGQHAIMAGQNEEEPKLIHLPQDSEIAEGSRLVTSGYGEMFPHGLAVGKVFVDKDGSLRVSLFSNFDRIQIVRILLKSEEETQDE